MRAEDVPKIRQISSQTKYHGVAMGITMGRCMDTAGRVPHNTMGWCPPHHEVWIDRRDRDGHWFASRDVMAILRQCVGMQISGPASPHRVSVMT